MIFQPLNLIYSRLSCNQPLNKPFDQAARISELRFQRAVFLFCSHITCTDCFLYLFVLFVLFTLDLMSRLPSSLALPLWPECQFVIRAAVLDAVYFGLGRLCRSEQRESFSPQSWSMVPSAARWRLRVFLLSIVILSASLLWDFFPFLFSFLSTHLCQPVCRFFYFFLSLRPLSQVECNLQQIWWSPKIREHDLVLWLRWVLAPVFCYFNLLLLKSTLLLFFLCIHQQNLSSIAVDLVSLACQIVACCCVAGLW